MPITTLTTPQKDACDAIGKQLARDNAQAQMHRVANAWENCMKSPGNGQMGRIVRRVFMVLRTGGLMFRSSRVSPHWEWWGDRGWPVASALGHGGRVIIQLPVADVNSRAYDESSQHDDGFWNWLTENGNGVETRIAATHGLTVLNEPEALPGLRHKYIREEKGFGESLAPRNIDLKEHFFGARRVHHRHMGMNVALCGVGEDRFTAAALPPGSKKSPV